jgi:hypothetical protein
VGGAGVEVNGKLEWPANPGSNGAQDLGCICPVLDNNHGIRAPWPPDGWYVVEGCPIHAPNRLDDVQAA